MVIFWRCDCGDVEMQAVGAGSEELSVGSCSWRDLGKPITTGRLDAESS